MKGSKNCNQTTYYIEFFSTDQKNLRNARQREAYPSQMTQVHLKGSGVVMRMCYAFHCQGNKIESSVKNWMCRNVTLFFIFFYYVFRFLMSGK